MMDWRPYDPVADGPWPEISSRWGDSPKIVRIREDGVREAGYLDGSGTPHASCVFSGLIPAPLELPRIPGFASTFAAPFMTSGK